VASYQIVVRTKNHSRHHPLQAVSVRERPWDDGICNSFCIDNIVSISLAAHLYFMGNRWLWRDTDIDHATEGVDATRQQARLGQHISGVPCDRTPERGSQGLLTTNTILLTKVQNAGNFCYFIMVSSKRHQNHGKATLQSAFRIAQCCKYLLSGRSLTQPHHAVRTRTTRSKGRVSPPRSTYEDGGNQLIAPIRSLLFWLSFFLVSPLPIPSRTPSY